MSETLKKQQAYDSKIRLDSFCTCAYDVASGKLETRQGELLRNLALLMPDAREHLSEVVGKWPVIADDQESAKAFLVALENQLTGESAVPCLAQFSVEVNGKRYRLGFAGQYLHGGDQAKQIISCISLEECARAQEEKRRTLETDTLTGALTRGALEEKIRKMIDENIPFAFVMIDIDGFKLLNDSCGHPAGDRMLKALVENIQRSITAEDIIARIGGDEFVICLKGVTDEEEISKSISRVAVKTKWENNIYLSTSMGVCVFPKDGRDFEALYHKADIAMYCAKYHGGDAHLFYREGMKLPGLKVENNADEMEKYSDYSAGLMILYRTGRFIYPPEMGNIYRGIYDHRPIWQIFREDDVTDEETISKIENTMEVLLKEPSPQIRYVECRMINKKGNQTSQSIGMAAVHPGEIIITVTEIAEVLNNSKHLNNLTDFDQLTGTLNMNCFIRRVADVLDNDKPGLAAGEYAMLYCDVVRFKAINDTFGSIEGDKLLRYIARFFQDHMGQGGYVSRMGGDRFVAFVRKKGEALEKLLKEYFDAVAAYPLVYEVVSNMGIYVTTAEILCVEAMIDRANIAFSEIKGNYAEKYRFFDEEQRNAMLGEQEIVGMMTTALAEGQFVLNYQPQYDHATKKMVGAEALVRWMHPERGMISPAKFIPIFERNGFISKLDQYVFEQVCIFQRQCMDKNMEMVPISVNRTRYDIYQPDFVSSMERVRRKYDVPAHLIHIEITETVLIGGNEHVCRVIEQLHECGYVVEMDDFGSGYSSLNTLKAINLDVLKLDMDFLSEDFDNRGGTILSSVVRMAKWLGLPVIAEGVESLKQANYLQSIGCNYLQGYLYARPMPEGAFRSLLEESPLGEPEHKLELIETLNPGTFWSPDSLDTLIFSNYVGGAAIFDYYDDKIEIIRVNPKYEQEIGSTLTTREIVRMNVNELFDEENRKIFTDMLIRAIESGEEEECETWRTYGDNAPICIRSSVRVIGQTEKNYIFYEMIRNITLEKDAEAEVNHREKLFRAASEQANIYYWEYDVATRKMYPCFRCMRDMGLPPLVENYPEPAIEMGIFPPEVANLYREMHRNIENGVPEQEVNMPLTGDRVMFRVKYTTEFDENGKPVKAYGSATML